MKIVLILIFLGLLVGCAASQPLSALKFHKDGANEMDYKKAAYECERDALLIPMHPAAYAYSGGLIGYTAIKETEKKQKDFYIRCMESKGFKYIGSQ
jgi:hypothetical protein